jgi:uncharacterized Zn finger protein
MGWYGFRPYVPVAKRRAKALREVARRAKNGHQVSPVTIDGRKIATTFWGQAWCDNLESYSDYENRLPRGRTYVRNGSVVDLQIKAGKVTALVSGSSLYTVKIDIEALPELSWRALKRDCAGQIGSLVELLQGKLSKGVMERVAQPATGLFPAPKQIKISCSCPDWAGMCKHVAATLYGVGARLDQQPELLFVLRKVDHLELIEQAGAGLSTAPRKRRGKSTLADSELADVFGIEIATGESESPPIDDQTKTPATRRRVAARPRQAADNPGGKAAARKAKQVTTVTQTEGEQLPDVSPPKRPPGRGRPRAAKPAKTQTTAKRKSSSAKRGRAAVASQA